MANLFVNLVTPAGNGVGAAVDTSGMGSPKTITVEGTFPGATIVVEASVDGGTVYAPVVTLQNGAKEASYFFSADHMRLRVSGRNSVNPFSAVIGVGASDAGALFSAIALPVGNGAGAAVDISAFAGDLTFIVGGSLVGAAIRIEISEDNISWAPLLSFVGAGGLRNGKATSRFVRAVVSGRSSTVPFSATLAVGAANAPGGGGSATGNPQRFSYTATGVEADRKNLVITLPAARANALYLVQISQEQASFELGMNVQTASKTINQFVLSLSAISTAGDKFVFTVADPT